MKFCFDFQERRNNEDGMKYSSLESRFLGDVFKSTLDNDNLPSYDGKLFFKICSQIRVQLSYEFVIAHRLLVNYLCVIFVLENNCKKKGIYI